MRILLICEQADSSDGWGTYTRSLADVLQREHDVYIWEGKSEGMGPLSILANPLRIWHLSRRITKLVRSYKPDVIHITVEPYALALSLLSTHITGRTVLTIHGTYGVFPLRYLRSRPFAKRALLRAARCITVSNYTRDAVLRELRDRRWHRIATAFDAKTTVIHNGIFLPPWNFQAGESHGIHRVLLVGGVKPRKGILEALDACAAYMQRYGRKLRFSVVGSNNKHSDYFRAVEKRVAQLCLSGVVEFCGHVSKTKLAEMYQQSHLYLMPARTLPANFEGFGLVFLEANAYGVPCIGPNTSGAAEAIQEGVSGYQVDTHNADDIAERMHWVLDERRITAEACRKWAEAHSRESMAAATMDLYARVA